MMMVRATRTILWVLTLSVPLFAESPNVPSLSTIGKFRFDISSPSTRDFGKTIASTASMPRCRNSPGSTHPIGEEENDCRYAAPYMSTYLYAISTLGLGEIKDLVPVDSVQAGTTVAEHIRTQSTRGPFRCKNGECSWVIASSPHAGSFFLCHVVEGQAIPTDCEPILIGDRGQTWLSVVVASSVVASSALENSDASQSAQTQDAAPTS